MPPRSQAELDLARADCQAMVRSRARLSAGAAVIPLPGMDMVADVMVFSSLLEGISQRFGLAHGQLAQLDPATRKYVLLAAGRLGSDLIGRLISKQLTKLVLHKVGSKLLGKTVLRFVPLAGQAAAAAISYRVVARLGNDHIDDCYRVAQALLAQPQENP